MKLQITAWHKKGIKQLRATYIKKVFFYFIYVLAGKLIFFS